MSFGEFVEVTIAASLTKHEHSYSLDSHVQKQIITTFSCFEKRELMQYFFYILDPMRTGLIEKVTTLEAQCPPYIFPHIYPPHHRLS